MKNEIIAYITSTINQYERSSEECSVCTIENVVNDLTDLEDFIADLKENVSEVVSKDAEAIYVKRIIELEKEAEYSNALWNAVNSKLTKENEKLNEKINKLEFWG